jgi:hypothetical protein
MRKFLLVMLASSSLFTYAQKLHLKSGEFVPSANVGQIENFSQWQTTQYLQKSYCIVQFDRSTSIEERNAMSKVTGIQFFDYLPRWAFIASIPVQYDVNKLAQYHVRSVLPFEATYKVHPKLAERPFPVWMQKGNRVELYIQPMNLVAQAEAEKLFAQHNIQFISWKNEFTARVQVTEQQLNQIGHLPWIKYVLPTSAPAVLENLQGRSSHRMNVLDASYATGLHYNGDGISVGEGDDGEVGPHIDFKGRLIHHTTSNGGTHGDHVGGIIAGAGNFNPITTGNAPGAMLHIYSYYNNLSSAPTDYNTDGIRITSNSLGQGCNDGYDSDAQDADILINSKFSLMSVHSSGNSGQSSCGGVGQGFFTITGGYKAGKNVIATGNLEKDDDLAPSSSRGPAADGRIKPDIVAVGTDVLSTQPDNTYDSFTGTSMACPGAAGTLASLWQAYKATHGGNDPYSAIMKCVLLNSADDLGNRGPDFKFGFGRINARRAYNIINSNQFLVDSIANGGSNSHVINVPTGTKQVKVMLYWHDVDGSPASSIPLVNNLNMRVQDPNSVFYFPWVLNHASNVAALNSLAIRANDSINNVEQVTIDSLPSGAYTIVINGHDIPQGNQKYVVCYEFIGEELVLTYPQGGESFVPGVSERIRWDAYGNNLGNFTLEYSDNNGTSWNLISNAIPADDRNYSWTPPNLSTGQMKMRISRGPIQDVSDTLFSIIPVPTGLMLDTACATTFHLVWNPVASATGYKIYMLGNKYMEEIGTSTSPDFYVTSGVNTTDTFYFAVASTVAANGANGRRCIAYTKLPGEINCLDDAEVSETILPFSEIYNCATTGTTFPIKMKIKNVGFRDISNIPVRYNVNGGIVTSEIYPGPLNVGDSVIYTFAGQANFTLPGVYTVQTWTALLSDVSTLNDTASAIATVLAPVPMVGPAVQDFEGPLFPPPGWRVFDYDANVKWQKTFCLSGATNGNTNAAYMDFFNYNNKAQLDDLETALIDLTAVIADSAILTFDLAHAYGPLELDTLSLWISDDCAQTFVPTSYKKWGANLATVGMMNTIFSPNATSQWRNDQLDLSAYKTKEIFVRFRGHNSKGNNLYIDNVNIMLKNAWPLGLNPYDNSNVAVYPNPSDGNYTIEFMSSSAKAVQYNVYTISGQLVKNNTIQLTSGITKAAITITDLAAGMYLLEVKDGEKIQRIKLSKN